MRYHHTKFGENSGYDLKIDLEWISQFRRGQSKWLSSIMLVYFEFYDLFLFEIRPFSCKMTFSTVNKVIFCDNFHRKNFVKIYADVSLAWIWTRSAWDWLKIVLVGYVWNGLSPRSLEWTLVWGFTFLKSDRVWNWMWTSRWVTIYSSIMSSP